MPSFFVRTEEKQWHRWDRVLFMPTTWGNTRSVRVRDKRFPITVWLQRLILPWASPNPTPLTALSLLIIKVPLELICNSSFIFCFWCSKKKIPQKLAFHWSVQAQAFSSSWERLEPHSFLTTGRFWGRSNGGSILSPKDSKKNPQLQTVLVKLSVSQNKTWMWERDWRGGRDERLAVRIARIHYIQVWSQQRTHTINITTENS